MKDKIATKKEPIRTLTKSYDIKIGFQMVDIKKEENWKGSKQCWDSEGMGGRAF